MGTPFMLRAARLKLIIEAAASYLCEYYNIFGVN